MREGSTFLSSLIRCRLSPACFPLLGRVGGGQATPRGTPMVSWKAGVLASGKAWWFRVSLWLPGRLSYRGVPDHPPCFPAFLEPSVESARKGSARAPLELQILSPPCTRGDAPTWVNAFNYDTADRRIIVAQWTLLGFQEIFPKLIALSSLNKSRKCSVGIIDEETGAKRLSDLQGVTPAKQRQGHNSRLGLLTLTPTSG